MSRRAMRVAARSARLLCVSRDRRPRLLAAAILYVLTALVLPGLHVASHRDDHDHQAGGQQRYTAAFFYARQDRGAAHRHGAGPAHTHQEPPARIRAHWPGPLSRHAAFASRSPGSDAAPDPHHGAGSLAHFAGSLLPGSVHIDLPLAGFLSSGADPWFPCPFPPPEAPRSALGARAPPSVQTRTL